MLLQKKYSLVNDKLYVKSIKNRGKGIFTNSKIKKGEIIIVFGGYVMTKKQHMKLPRKMWPCAYNISDDILFGIKKEKEISIVERLNHSCEPNCGFKDQLFLVAIKNISKGEEVTMDYAFAVNSHDFYMKCHCGVKICRKVIKYSDWKLPQIIKRYKQYYHPYLKEKINQVISNKINK